MIWNVYAHDINRGEIRVWNVFKHGLFNRDVEKLLKEDLTYEDFSKRLKRETMYYFWSKAEYEVVITSWAPHIDNKELDRLNAEREKYSQYRLHNVNLDVGEKIDIYDQLLLNWEQFAESVWNFKAEVKENELSI